MKATTLSLCLIAKNEAGNISRCINSAKDFVDEIILVDTGSSDDTMEIARNLGAKVIEEAWQNDFSLARNVSLENAGGDWILFLDCDEELTPEGGREFRKLIQDSPYEAYYVLVTNKTEIDTELVFPSIRLFRNRDCFRFEGKIHEQIVNSVVRNFGQQSLGQTDFISIVHHGYNAKTTNIPAKIQRNMEILKRYGDEEKDGFYLYNLGTEYLRRGEREKALAAYMEATKLTKPMQGYGPILVKKTMTTLMELRRYRDALAQLRYYQTIYREYNDLVFLEGVCHLDCGRYTEAMSSLQRYQEMPPPPAWYPTETVYQGASAEDFLNRYKALSISRDYPAISVCIIGRDEAESIGRCIKSVNEIAGEIIYVDTGSLDQTPVIAYQMGAVVYNVPWNRSYGEVRNFALARAKGEWILFIDADEMLPDQSKVEIVNLIKNAGHAGYILKICTFTGRDLSLGNCHVAGKCRLFRKGGSYYTGEIEEDVLSSLLNAGLTAAPADIAVYHLHYHAENKQIEHKRRIKIEAIQLQMASGSWRQSYAQGVEYFYAQDFAAAVKLFEICFGQPEVNKKPNLFYYYALSLTNTKDFTRAFMIAEEGMNLFSDYTDLIYLTAITCFMLGNIEKAELLLNRCLETGDAPWEKYLISPGVGSFKAMCSLGTIYARKGEVAKALEILTRASALAGGFEQAIENIVFILDKLPLPLEKFLEDKGLLNSYSLSLVSNALAKTGRYKECLSYLTLAMGQVAREAAPRNFANITNAIDLLLARFQFETARSLPGQLSSKNLAI